ncbi:GAF domain-containing SpoIIE family protein phosphatase [Streptomyces fuscigenes]|uniref:GAF domain-containing SpoIIE family protein phosphatase n=1 Tax=Streptomyces fuscigenes TaxID=1528880 RepID=UPI001F30CE5D|nr:GAF domain-containing SpoIIE family protein phosphatase [Streptomyces fuscigenes]MCF3961873.1 SpoIIE family protein phosphatase [Streptomyces fuscigenes]
MTRSATPGRTAGPERAPLLRLTGLSAVADDGMDRFARLAARVLGVPLAFVSLLEEDRQILPGAFGPPGPWTRTRTAPLSDAPWSTAVLSGRPFVLTEAAGNGPRRPGDAAGGPGGAACVALPVTDGAHHVLGALCALDDRPRTWDAEGLAALEDVAAACSAELGSRILARRTQDLHRRARSAQETAELTGARAVAARGRAEAARRSAEVAQDEAEEGRDSARELEQQARQGLQHAELLLAASEDLAQSVGVEDVRRRLRSLFAEPVGYVGLLLAENGGLRRVQDPDVEYRAEGDQPFVPLDTAFPSTRAFREGRTVLVPDRDALAAEYSEEALAGLDALGMSATLCVPLTGSRGPLGVLALCWPQRHEVAVIERATFTAVAGYVAQAVERALFVDERISVAHQLQAAMLTDLPAVDGLEIAAVYVPAAVDDMVGGDWYDAYRLPAAQPHGDPDPVVVTVGDITGHDMHAATVMGQIRSMLRQATFDHASQGPAAALAALDRTSTSMLLEPGGTLVHARFDPAQAGSWTLTWSNAGHPMPLLLDGRGRVTRLVEHDAMLHPVLGTPPRSERRLTLGPGSILFLYTDGVVERRGEDIDAATQRLADLLAEHRALPLPALLDRVVRHAAAPGEDDITLLAVRIRPGDELPGATGAGVLA